MKPSRSDTEARPNDVRDIDAWTRNTISGLIRVCDKADVVPSNNEYKFFSSYKKFNDRTQSLSNSVSSLISDICQFVNAPTFQVTGNNELQHSNSSSNTNTNSRNNNLNLKFGLIQDTADYCLEKVEKSLKSDKSVKRKETLNTNMSNLITANGRQFGVCLCQAKQQKLVICEFYIFVFAPILG